MNKLITRKLNEAFIADALAKHHRSMGDTKGFAECLTVAADLRAEAQTVIDDYQEAGSDAYNFSINVA